MEVRRMGGCGILGIDALNPRLEGVMGRLRLVNATREHFEAELASPARLASMLGTETPVGWPPGEYDSDAIRFFRDRLMEHPDHAPWYVWYALEHPAPGGQDRLVGVGGYFGPPTEDGTVEIGYSILPDCQRQGFATALAQALASRAFADPAVLRVIAQTHPSNTGSVRTLLKAGFVFACASEDPIVHCYVQFRPEPRRSSQPDAEAQPDTEAQG